MILVDEAAALPAPLLKSILLGWPRVAFATTVHGYEGAGRGFAIRFRQVLEQSTPHWQAATLTEPVRWARGDPLETLITQLFLLAADGSGSAVETENSAGELVIEPWQPATASDEALSNAFGLLVDAHYRTSPADLRQWLDDIAAEAGGRELANARLEYSGVRSKVGFRPGWRSRSVWGPVEFAAIYCRSHWPATAAILKPLP